MNRRRILIIGVWLVLGLGLCSVVVPFGASLAPAEGADLKLPHIDVSSLRPGQYGFYSTKRSLWFEAESIFVLRDPDGALHVFTVPTKEGAVVLPDIHWWARGALCKSFGPTPSGGIVTSDTVLSCHDPNLPEWQKSEDRWALSGRNLGRYTDDLPTTKYAVQGPYLVIGRGS
jgi:hypothetical protein